MIGPLFARRLRTHHTPPPTPTNRERIRAYRALAPVELGNGNQWKWHRKYAAEAVPGPDYEQELREAAAFKYGEQA